MPPYTAPAPSPDPFRPSLTRAQRRVGRFLLQSLHDLGVSVNGLHVAEHFDTVMAWYKGNLSISALLHRTGWETTRPTAFPQEPTCQVELTPDALEHIRLLLTQTATPKSKAVLLLLRVPLRPEAQGRGEPLR